MNRSRTVRLIFAALAVAILLVVAIGLPGAANPSSGEAAGAAVVTRVPRPHPQSQAATVSSVVLSVRPHPISHRSFPPGIDLLNPRPHPTSHIGLALTRP
jgi:hypothetical protein